MAGLKALYHRAIPEAVRNPLGLFRRKVADRFRRFVTPLPIPPRPLLEQIQLTPWAKEYLEVGKRSADSVLAALESGGLRRGKGASVLDFGCGSGRALRHLGGSGWQLSGCDVDAVAIGWCTRAFPFADFAVSRPDPPLPYPDGPFDALFAISVFTHFAEEQQLEWCEEMARVLRPGGLAVISTMGRDVLAYFDRYATGENRRTLEETGFLFVPVGEAFNSNAAFHTPAGLTRLFGTRFDRVLWAERGLDGFQDMTLLRRRP